VSFAVLSAFLCPLFAGAFIAYALLGGGRHWASIISLGYLIGFTLCAVLLYFSALFIGQFSTAFVYCGLVVASIISGLMRGRHRAAPKVAAARGAGEILICILLLGLAGLHFYAAFFEALLRPVFPWDAWNSWYPMTLQYLANNALEAGLDTMKGQAHPPTMNLLEVWILLSSGSESTVFQLLWPAAHLAIALLCFGFLREQGASLPVASLCLYCIASVPLLLTHAALAGYAGIWLALATTAAFVQSRHAQPMGGLILLCLIPPLFKFSGLFVTLEISALFAPALIIRSREAGGPSLIRWLLYLFAASVIVAVLANEQLQALARRLDRDFLRGDLLSSDTLLALRSIGESYWKFSSWGLAPYLTLIAICLYGASRDFRSSTLSRHGRVLGLLSLVFIAIASIYFSVVSPLPAISQTGYSRAVLPAIPTLILAALLILAGYQHTREISGEPGPHSR
jgi:hypothetical protein